LGVLPVSGGPINEGDPMSQQAVKELNVAPKTPAYAWVVLSALYMASLAAPLNLFKVPPVMTTLEKEFSLSSGDSGMLMSIFSIMGFILAIPAGYILKRFGIKMTGLVAVGAVKIGAGLGAVATNSSSLFYGRFIEGIGMGLIMVAAPLAISLWFPAQKRGLPMGLWASCVGIGNIATLILAPLMMASFGWRAVWWAGSGFSAVAFILFAVLFRLPRKDEMFEAPQPAAKSRIEESPSLTKAMANRSLWMISIAFGCYNLVVMAVSTFLPKFLEVVRGYSVTYDRGLFANASFVTSLIMMTSIFTGPAGGYLSDRLGKRKIMIIIPYVLMTLTFLFPFSVTGWLIPAYMIAFGIFGGPIAPVSLAGVPEVVPRPELVGIGMGVVAVGQNLGMFIGPALFGRMLESTSWATAGYLMIPICVIGIVATSLIKIR
jgi:MFS family permease